MDPATIRSLGSRIRKDLALLRRRIYDPSGSVANCEGWIYDPNGSGIQILGIRSRDPFSGSTDMSDWLCGHPKPFFSAVNDSLCLSILLILRLLKKGGEITLRGISSLVTSPTTNPLDAILYLLILRCIPPPPEDISVDDAPEILPA